MKVSQHWLNSFFSQDFTSDEIEKALLCVGIEIESIEQAGEGLDHVVVGRIESFVQHPNADKLSLCKVTDGLEQFDVVCGAKNFKQGDQIAFAKIGAKLPNGMAIKKSKIRSIESFGMLCSESELGLADDAEGIMILPKDTRVGESLKSVLGLDDVVFTLELTPNRGDCWSHLGVAYELAAAFNKSINVFSKAPIHIDSINMGCEIEATHACPFYSLTRIDNVAMTPSPQHVQTRLSLCGQRPKNNIVDATNYVMLERGQPLHAFDADKVKGDIRVRFAYKNESLLCLDEETRQLLETDLVIADNSGPIALAGVMGGLSTAVSDQTKNILVEGAWFAPEIIRKTSKRLHLSTESSKRYEREIDGSHVLNHALMAVGMIIDTSPNAQVQGGQSVGRLAVEPHTIVVGESAIQDILGIVIPDAHGYLTRLGFEVEKMGEGWKVSIPPRRPEIKREIDVIEEIARVYGYDRLPSSLPMLKSVPGLKSSYHQRAILKTKLVGLGLSEVYSDSFMNMTDIDSYQVSAIAQALEVENPIVSQKTMMKTSLIPNLLEIWKYNETHQQLGGAFFEIGRVFGLSDGQTLEQERLGVLLSGSQMRTFSSNKPSRYGYFDLKSMLEQLCAYYQVKLDYQEDDGVAFLHPGQSCQLTFKGEHVGCLGVFHPGKAEALGFNEDIILLEIATKVFYKHSQYARQFKQLSPYPLVRRDLAFVVKGNVTYGKLSQVLDKINSPVLKAYQLFDRYSGEGVEKGHQSWAFRFEFGSLTKTLKDKEVDKIMVKITQQLEKDLEAQIRS